MELDQGGRFGLSGWEQTQWGSSSGHKYLWRSYDGHVLHTVPTLALSPPWRAFPFLSMGPKSHLGLLMWPGVGQHIHHSGFHLLRAFSAPYRRRIKNLPKTTESRNYCLPRSVRGSMSYLSLHTASFSSSLLKKAILVVTICTKILPIWHLDVSRADRSLTRHYSPVSPLFIAYVQRECQYPSSATLYSIHFLSPSWFHLTRFY